MTKTSLFDYELPEELIAQYPAEKRDGSRMLVLDRKTGECEIMPFPEIRHFLTAGDALIYNDTRVLRGRMFARKSGDPEGAKFEILLVEARAPERRSWNVMLKPGKRALPGVKAVLLHEDGSLNRYGDAFTVLGRNDDGTFAIEFSDADSDRLQAAYGHIPLPPYIARSDKSSDAERYQTVYARESGAVAAPTAGLHFTPELDGRLVAKGIDIVEVTLNVGPGTFRPIQAENLSEHRMHEEWYRIPAGTLARIREVKASGGKIIAVGTTAARTLEAGAATGVLSGWTDLFIRPGFNFRLVDGLITNFHLPGSSLLVLVSALVGREVLLAAYARAVAGGWRFYSYGDAMLIYPGAIG